MHKFTLIKKCTCRYDVRGAIDDLETVSGIAGGEVSAVEQKEEELSEVERYFALYHDEQAVAEAEGEHSIMIVR